MGLALPSCGGSTRTQRSPNQQGPGNQEPITSPVSPSDLRAESISSTEVSLWWTDNSDNEDGFKVYRDGLLVAQLQANTGQYQDAGLKAGNTYRYLVRAFNAAGESEASDSSVKTPNPPLNVTLDHVGLKYDHNEGGEGEIVLIVLVDDGEQQEQFSIPPMEAPGLTVSDYDVQRVDERLFGTTRVGDYLKVAILAYHRTKQGADVPWAQIGGLVGTFFGAPDLGGAVGGIIDTMEEQAPEYEYVGYYQQVWGQNESWGTGQHSAVGKDDLRLWFRVSTDATQPIAEAQMQPPDVVIETAVVPSPVTATPAPFLSLFYKNTNTITLKNNELDPIHVTVKEISSTYGEVKSKQVIVPPSGTIDVTFEVAYYPAGERTMSFEIWCGDKQLDSWSGIVVAQ